MVPTGTMLVTGTVTLMHDPSSPLVRSVPRVPGQTAPCPLVEKCDLPDLKVWGLSPKCHILPSLRSGFRHHGKAEDICHFGALGRIPGSLPKDEKPAEVAEEGEPILAGWGSSNWLTSP